MSYLASFTSLNDYGVVEVGGNILVANGIISLDQDVGPNSSVNFSNVVSDNLYVGADPVITTINPSAGAGILLTNVVSSGYTASFEINNTGVLSLTAGTGIQLSANSGNITISSFGADLISVIGVNGNYTASVTDEYIGVSSANAITISLPTGINGRVYVIKDEYGQGSGKITIQPSGLEKIDNKANYIISVPNQSISLVSRSGNWWII